MTEDNRTYIAIDLKSFFASVECVERGLDPLTTNLVVADVSRTEKTICLAVSPSLKAYGIGGRARLFEVVQRLRVVNNERRYKSPFRRLTGKSWKDEELKVHEDWEVDYIAAPPRMAKYIEYSTRMSKGRRQIVFNRYDPNLRRIQSPSFCFEKKKWLNNIGKKKTVNRAYINY